MLAGSVINTPQQGFFFFFLVPRKNFRAILDSPPPPLQFLPFWLCALGQVGRVSVKGTRISFFFQERGGEISFLNIFFLPSSKEKSWLCVETFLSLVVKRNVVVVVCCPPFPLWPFHSSKLFFSLSCFRFPFIWSRPKRANPPPPPPPSLFS